MIAKRIKLLACLTVFAPLAFSLGTASAQTTVESLVKAGSVKHGIANDTPYGYYDQSGQLVGIEVEVAKKILANLGIKGYDPVVTTFGALIPGLKANRFDLASDAMYIRPERCEQAYFADPHLMFGEGAVVKKGNPKNVLGVEDLVKDKSVRIGMTTGGAQHQSFLKAGGDPNQLVDYPDRATLVAALKSGRIDVALLTAMGAITMYETNKDADFELVEDFKPLFIDGKPIVSYAAFAFRPEDKQFADAFSAELQKLIRTSEYADLMVKYGLKPSMLPPEGATAEAACAK